MEKRSHRSLAASPICTRADVRESEGVMKKCVKWTVKAVNITPERGVTARNDAGKEDRCARLCR